MVLYKEMLILYVYGNIMLGCNKDIFLLVLLEKNLKLSLY